MVWCDRRSSLLSQTGFDGCAGINPWYWGDDRPDIACGGYNISINHLPSATQQWKTIATEIIHGGAQQPSHRPSLRTDDAAGLRGPLTIDNVRPRRDQHGNILNAHDGHIITVGDTFWLFGTSYTHCLMTDSTSCLGTCGTMGVSRHATITSLPVLWVACFECRSYDSDELTALALRSGQVQLPDQPRHNTQPPRLR